MYETSNFHDEEHHPVTWFRGYPVYAVHLIVVFYVASLLVTTTMMAFRSDHLLAWLVFDSQEILRGQVWRAVSFGLVNPPSLSFAFDMLYLWWFGREVERTVGRQRFLWLYSAIYLVGPLLLICLGPWMPSFRSGETGALAVFVAFATIAPDAPLMFNLTARWAAAILVGIFSLIHLASRNTVDLICLWSSCGLAWWYIGVYRGRFSLPDFRFWRRKPKLRVLPDLPTEERNPARSSRQSTQDEMDALLDKIARSGLDSLSAKEKARLSALRDSLMKK